MAISTIDAANNFLKIYRESKGDVYKITRSWMFLTIIEASCAHSIDASSAPIIAKGITQFRWRRPVKGLFEDLFKELDWAISENKNIDIDIDIDDVKKEWNQWKESFDTTSPFKESYNKELLIKKNPELIRAITLHFSKYPNIIPLYDSYYFINFVAKLVHSQEIDSYWIDYVVNHADSWTYGHGDHLRDFYNQMPEGSKETPAALAECLRNGFEFCIQREG